MKRCNSTNPPLFFLFTCVKNGREYIEKLFNSLMQQTKHNFVHYIYEDGSSEPLNELLDEYKNKVAQLNNPFQIIYENNPVNIGLTRATQHCISKCNCPYFIWIDCDNYVDSKFFEELENLYKKNKNAILLRSTLYDTRTNGLYYANRGSIDEANTKYQFGLLIRRRFYYSFFAVNSQKYKLINPNNIMINEKGFYNDEQVLTLCLLESGFAPLSKKAKGYFLTRNQQESSLLNLSLGKYRDYQIQLCKHISLELENRITYFYLIKDYYDELFKIYSVDYDNSMKLVKKINSLSKTNNISLKNYYNYSLLKIIVKMNYWRIRNKWKKK